MIRFLSLLVVLLFVLVSCGEAPSETPAPPAPAPATAPAPPTAPTSMETGTELKTWVDRINVREEARTGTKVVARVPATESLTYLGEKTPTKETIVLRGLAYHEPWLRVRTQDGKEGWVFGGGVNAPGEKRGTIAKRETLLDYPYFGRYDLKLWEELPAAEASGGDAEITEKRYRRDGQTLILTTTDVGEYGYGSTQELRGVDDQVLLKREFSFSADPDFLLTETVTNNIEEPAVQRTRSQILDKHPVVLNARPTAVVGEWQEKPVSTENH